jgi:outer membrane receptor protein involved in Fe transport
MLGRLREHIRDLGRFGHRKIMERIGMEISRTFVVRRAGVAAAMSFWRWLKRAPLVASVFSIALLGPVGFAHAEEETVIEEMVVVGSRIQKPDYAFSNPVLSVGADDIKQSGTTNMAAFLKTLPALAGSFDAHDTNDVSSSGSFIGSVGLTQLNLRNLGTQRTLVLVNGRRHVSALEGSQVVDVDTIPFELTERVEVLTGGASAIYGADGVSGVVNFVTKTDYEGFNVRAQGGQSTHGDADTALFSLTAGKNFSDDRLNISGSYEYSREDGVLTRDRKFARERQVFVDNPFDPDDDPNLFDLIPLPDIGFSDSSPGGAVDTNFDFSFVPDFHGSDRPWDLGSLGFIDPFLQQGGDGSRLNAFVQDLLPEVERHTANLFLNFELHEAARFYGEVKYSKNDSFAAGQPTFDFFLWLEPDYAYLPPNISAAVDEELGGCCALVSRDHFDLGGRSEDITRETWRTVFGITGDFADDFTYDISYVWGETDVKLRNLNNRYNDRFAAAIDAVVDPDSGEIVCRSNLDPTLEPFNIPWNVGFGWNAWEPLPGTWAGSFQPGPDSGCLPVNLLSEGGISPAAADWINSTTTWRSKIEQQVFSAYLTGSTQRWFSLPAGAVQFAVGYEWRDEKSSSRPDDIDQAGLTYLNQVEDNVGDFDVSEFFAEIDVPLLSGVRGAELLSVDAAVRFSDYSTIGNATSWKVGAIWQPIEDITFRGTVAEATRAPNIGELFDPGGQTFQFLDDPCDINELSQGTPFRADNCAQILTALGVDPTTFTDPNSASVEGLLRGNPDLDEEVADTYTVGIVLRPRFVPNLTVSVDWYDIEIKDAINTALPQTAADECVDLPTIDNSFCDLVVRSADNFGGVVFFEQTPLNVASFTTEGYDFTVEYLLDPNAWGAKSNIGLFNFRLIGNKLEDLTFIKLPDAAPDEDLGEEDAPEWQLKFDLTWSRGPLTVNYGFTYFNETDRFTTGSTLQQLEDDRVDPKYLQFDAKFEQDIYAAYEFGDSFELFGGVNNITNEKPDIGETYYPYSAVGRFYFLGFTYTYNR